MEGYLPATLIVAAATVVACLVRQHLELADVVMVYLAGIILVSTRVGYGPSLYAALLSVASLDFFCVPPIFSFAVSDLQHVMTFAVMLLVAAVMTTLTDRVRRHAVAAIQRERHTAALYAASRELASVQDARRLAAIAARHMSRALDAKVALFLPGVDGRLDLVSGRDMLPDAPTLYVPLVASRGVIGVAGIEPLSGARLLQEERALLDAFVSQAAVAIERSTLAAEAERSRLQADSEHLRNTLFSSISHDLRTPLAAVTGAAAMLRDDPTALSSLQRELVETVVVQAERLGRILTNLLEMARLESGSLKLRREWQPIDEVVGSAIHRLQKKLAGRTVDADVSRDLPLVEVDAVLMEQVLLNLLENALKYTPAGSSIEVSARRADADRMVIEVGDHGPGIPPGEEERIFEKFRRADASGVPGFGLGLTICRGIVDAHGGRIVARNRDGGGAVFSISLPAKDAVQVRWSSLLDEPSHRRA